MVSNWIVAYSLLICVPLALVLICCVQASVLALHRDAEIIFFIENIMFRYWNEVIK
jgi:hypothetical protein